MSLIPTPPHPPHPNDMVGDPYSYIYTRMESHVWNVRYHENIK